MSRHLLRPLKDRECDVSKGFQETLCRGACRFALGIARIQSGELRPLSRKLTASDKLQQCQHPQRNRQ